MNDYTDTIERTEALVQNYRYYVKAHNRLKTRDSKKKNEIRIEKLISLAAANGMSKDELDELAEVEW